MVTSSGRESSNPLPKNQSLNDIMIQKLDTSCAWCLRPLHNSLYEIAHPFRSPLISFVVFWCVHITRRWRPTRPSSCFLGRHHERRRGRVAAWVRRGDHRSSGGRRSSHRYVRARVIKANIDIKLGALHWSAFPSRGYACMYNGTADFGFSKLPAEKTMRVTSAHRLHAPVV